jgi:hypothetical protein
MFFQPCAPLFAVCDVQGFRDFQIRLRFYNFVEITGKKISAFEPTIEQHICTGDGVADERRLVGCIL